MGGYELLLEILDRCGGGLLAFSGGTDSALLAAAAREAGVPILAVTAVSPLLPRSDLLMAREIAAALGFPHRLVEAGEMGHPDVLNNLASRCYHCKRVRLQAMRGLADQEGFAWILEGSRADDDESGRPGMRAVKELGARSPLRESGMGREEVEESLRRLGLRDFIRPSNSCLATRFPGGHRLSPEELRFVDEAEDLLREKGLLDIRLRWKGRGELLLETSRAGLEALGVRGRESLREELRELLRLPLLELGFSPCRGKAAAMGKRRLEKRAERVEGGLV